MSGEVDGAASDHQFGIYVRLTLWSPQRVAAWQSTLTLPREAPLAELRIPRIHLEVPVMEGTSDVTLNRGVGHIEETALPGTSSNSAIAGHRDGFFRGLTAVNPGDAIELDTLQGTQNYRIERAWIVTPEEVSALDPTPVQSITLVTCYPFYFVGSAPQTLHFAPYVPSHATWRCGNSSAFV
ncbi:MAG TPA: class D sortase [Vicinamibacterales bacterium]|nr:class D sortase [Vicinamibacterales bacterium]